MLNKKNIYPLDPKVFFSRLAKLIEIGGSTDREEESAQSLLRDALYKPPLSKERKILLREFFDNYVENGGWIDPEDPNLEVEDQAFLLRCPQQDKSFWWGP